MDFLIIAKDVDKKATYKSLKLVFVQVGIELATTCIAWIVIGMIFFKYVWEKYYLKNIYI